MRNACSKHRSPSSGAGADCRITGAAAMAAPPIDTGAGASDRAGIAARDHSPDHQNDNRSDHSADQSGPFARPVPSERLSEIGGDERPDDPEYGRQDEAGGLVWAGMDEFRDHASHKADDDSPKNAH